MSELNTELATLGAYAATLEYRECKPIYKAMQARVSGKRVWLSPFADRLAKQRSAEWGQSHTEAIVGRTALLEAFTPFSEAAHYFTELAIHDRDALENHPNFVASSSDIHVASHQIAGRQYAMRIKGFENKDWYSNPDRHDFTEKYVNPLLRGKGMPFMEQIVAFSYEQSVTVSELLPGSILPQSNDLEDAPEEHLQQFMGTLQAAEERGICLDINGKNITYDRQSGFYHLDYHVQDDFLQPSTPAESISLLDEYNVTPAMHDLCQRLYAYL